MTSHPENQQPSTAFFCILSTLSRTLTRDFQLTAKNHYGVTGHVGLCLSRASPMCRLPVRTVRAGSVLFPQMFQTTTSKVLSLGCSGGYFCKLKSQTSGRSPDPSCRAFFVCCIRSACKRQIHFCVFGFVTLEYQDLTAYISQWYRDL